MDLHTILYIARHGCTDWNLQNIVQGWSSVPLNSLGISQSIKLSSEIFKKGNIDCIISSDLTRAQQTAEIISEKLEIPVCYNKGLREKNPGILQGKSFNEIEVEYPHLSSITQISGSEPIRKFIKRCQVTFEDIIRTHERKRILIITHEEVIKYFCAFVIKRKIEKLENAEYVLVEYDSKTEKWTLKND